MRVREVARDRWRGILGAIGIPDKALTGKHGPCPMCGGRDRFRFDDKDGRGTYFCTHCGAGDGVALVMAFRGIDFKAAATEIESVAGIQPLNKLKPEMGDDEKFDRLRRVWSESRPLAAGDEGMAYLKGRGIVMNAAPLSLRLHAALPYHDGERVIGTFPAILGLVVGPDGKALTLHRIYVQGGRKAPVEEPKKLMPGKPITGGAIRLGAEGERIGIAEGIETALAASILFGIPTWACVNTHGLETFQPPEGVATVTVFADNDKSFAGQKAAYVAAHRLRRNGFDVEVVIPRKEGDWLDVLNEERRA